MEGLEPPGRFLKQDDATVLWCEGSKGYGKDKSSIEGGDHVFHGRWGRYIRWAKYKWEVNLRSHLHSLFGEPPSNILFFLTIFWGRGERNGCRGWEGHLDRSRNETCTRCSERIGQQVVELGCQTRTWYTRNYVKNWWWWNVSTKEEEETGGSAETS